ncbi:MAG: ATP-binding protein [Candidatus Thorarchaeota archaeon]
MNPEKESAHSTVVRESQQRIILALSYELLDFDNLNNFMINLLKLISEIYPIELIVLQDSSKLLSHASLNSELLEDFNSLSSFLQSLQTEQFEEEVGFYSLEETPGFSLLLNGKTIHSVLLIRTDGKKLSEDLYLGYISFDPAFRPLHKDFTFFKTVSNLAFFIIEHFQLDSSLPDLDLTAKEKDERARREYEQRRELLRKLSVQAKTLRNKNTEIEEFVYTISHDLKAPLISIQGFTAAIKEEYGEDLPEEAQFYLDRIIKNVQIIETQIKQILEYSRIGRIVTTPKRDLDLREIIEECLSQYTTQIKKNNIRIVISDEFPQIHAEENRMMQLFSNLIGNSIKYRGDNPSPIIEIGKHAIDENFIAIYVRDNGIGVPEKFQSRIFNLFARAPSMRTRDIEGTGIGLAHVKKIVETHGGRIWMESTEGVGTTIFFELPLSQGSSMP